MCSNRRGRWVSEVDFSLPGERVIRSLEQIIERRGKALTLRCDNGPGYIDQNLIDRATQKRITSMHIQRGKRTQNTCVEQFNRTVRHGWLDLHSFNSIRHVQLLATLWFWTCNNERPHTAIAGIPPGKLPDAA